MRVVQKIFSSIYRLPMVRQLCNRKIATISITTACYSSNEVIGVPDSAVPDYRQCLQLACLLNVNAASSLLTTTVFSIDTLAEKYIKALGRLSGLLEECVLLNGWNNELWDSVIAVRNETDELKAELTAAKAVIDSVNNVVNAVIETSFNINSNYLCTTLCEQSHSAEEKLLRLDKEIKESEETYLLALTAVAKYTKPDDTLEKEKHLHTN